MTTERDISIRRGSSRRIVVRWETEPYLFAAISSITRAAPAVLNTQQPHGLPDGWNAAMPKPSEFKKRVQGLWFGYHAGGELAARVGEANARIELDKAKMQVDAAMEAAKMIATQCAAALNNMQLQASASNQSTASSRM